MTASALPASCGSDIKLEGGEIALGIGDFELVEGGACVAQDILERLKTDRGALFYAPNFGAGIPRFIHAPSDKITPVEFKAALINALQSDARVLQNSIAVSVSAKEEGALYNQPGGRVNILVTPIQGVDRVSNPSDWLTRAGADMESDASLRLRCLSQWGGIGGANSAAYVSWAKSVGGVGQVSIVPTARGAGTVDVVFTAEGNAQPSAELIAQVQSLIDGKRPVATDALARAPSELLLNLALNVVFYPNFTPNRALVEAAVYAYFAKLGIGVDFEPSQLIASVQMIEGVKSVEVVEPKRQAVSVLQIARLANLSAAVSNAADA